MRWEAVGASAASRRCEMEIEDGMVPKEYWEEGKRPVLGR